MSVTALKKLVESSKASVLVAVLALLGVMLYSGKIDTQQFLDTIKYLVPSWMAAHAAERGLGAKALADAAANGNGAGAAKPPPLPPDDKADGDKDEKEEAA